MTRGISRDSFDERKQYTGVHLQQGRPILDADWNESQDIMSSLIRRVGQDALRDGVVTEGFEIQPLIPSLLQPLGGYTPEQYSSYCLGGLPHFLRFPGDMIDDFESADGWTASTSCNKRIVRDRPYAGRGFLRVSGHTGALTLTKTLGATTDFSSYQYGTFRFRLNQTIASGGATPPPFFFFLEDQDGNRSTWRITGVYNAKDTWAPALIVPLNLRFHLVDLDALPAYRDESYSSYWVAPGLAADAAVTWSPSGSLPPGLSLSGGSAMVGIAGIPTRSGPYTFKITGTSGTSSAEHTVTLTVQDPPAMRHDVSHYLMMTVLGSSYWATVGSGINLMARTSKTGAGADLRRIRKYGVTIFQDSASSLIWDFDSLSFASRQMLVSRAANNFVIAGPLQEQVSEQRLLKGALRDLPVDPLTVRALNKPRLYVSGHPCTQTRDTLYSDQADPSDTSLAPPAGTAIRRDLVYLDVWSEPVTYVEDPDIREIALGGPDTTTRVRVRQRVRVSQGGTLPIDDGVGQGTLSTEGTYTDNANRLYLIEIDTPGDVGIATFRWSEDNASTIQRVIEAVPAGTMKVRVEDASAFRSGDLVLLRKEFAEEEHQITSISGNVISFHEATTTAFSLADRPKIQRWNGFRNRISLDPADPPLSSSIDLSHGVKVRFGGRAMKKRDCWTFRTRYLAGDAASSIDPAARIETLDFQRARGVVHAYTPLALLLRDPGAHEPTRIHMVRDLRQRSGAAGGITTLIPVYRSGTNHLGGIDLGPTSDQSSFLCLWSGQLTPMPGAGHTVSLRFYNSAMTDPVTEPDTGKVKEISFVAPAGNPAQQILYVPGVVSSSQANEITSVQVVVTSVGTVWTGETYAFASSTLQVLELSPGAISAATVAL